MRATEKSKRALAEKESELRRLAEEAEALRTSSDKLKELEKEHGKERKKSIAMISKMDQLGLDVEKLKATIELLTKDKEEREKVSEKSHQFCALANYVILTRYACRSCLR